MCCECLVFQWMDIAKAVISRLLIGNLDTTVPFPKRCFLPHLQLHAPYLETQNLTTIIAWMILLLGYSCKCVFCLLSTLTTFTPTHAIQIMASPVHFSNALPSKTKPLIDLHTEMFTPAMYYRLAVLRHFVHCYIIYVCTFNFGWTVRGSNPGGGEIFRTCPDRLRGPPSLLYNGYRIFPGGNAAEAWR